MYIDVIHALIERTEMYKLFNEIDKPFYNINEIRTIRRKLNELYNRDILLQPIIGCGLSLIDNTLNVLKTVKRKNVKLLKHNKKLKCEYKALTHEIEKLRRLKTINCFGNNSLSTIRVYPS
jgi:hypothetical protein